MHSRIPRKIRGSRAEPQEVARARPPASDTIGESYQQADLEMHRVLSYILLLPALSIPAIAQDFRVSKSLPTGASIEVINPAGRVSVAVPAAQEHSDEPATASS